MLHFIGLNDDTKWPIRSGQKSESANHRQTVTELRGRCKDVESSSLITR